MKNRYLRWIVFLAIGMGIGAMFKYYQKDKALEGEVTELSAATILKKPVSAPIAGAEEEQAAIGGPFTLVDQNGQTVTQDNYKDSYKLIFFGFTYCPAICPTELQKIVKVLDGLGETANKIQPMLISVDPQRDTPERMKEYVAQFSPRIVGLTGTPEQIEAVKNAYRVYASKVEMEGTDEYMMDHSSYTYFMSPDNQLIAIYPSTDSVNSMVTDIKSKLSSQAANSAP